MDQNRNSRPRRLTTPLKIAFGFALLAYILYKYFDLGALRGLRLNVGIFTVFVFLYLGVVCLAALRWRFIIKRLYGVELPYRTIIPLTYFGQTMGLVTPSRVGDFGRALFIEKALPKKKALISLLYDKVPELGMLCLFALTSILLFHEKLRITLRHLLERTLEGGFAGLAIIIVIVSVLLILAFIAGKKYVMSLLKEHIADPLTLGGVLLFTSCIMGATFAPYYLVPLSLGYRPPFIIFIAVGVLQSAISMVPITISGIGLREGVSVVLFPLAGIDESGALLVTWIGMLGYSIIPALVGGIAYLWKKGAFVEDVGHT